MRVLITGASGFAGGHLAQQCVRAGDHVIGLVRSGSLPEEAGERMTADLLNADAVRRALRSVQPEVVYHLAALSHVGRSWEQPARTINDNAAIAVNLLEAVRREAPRARVVWASSCEVYGFAAQLPVQENAQLAPANPYAVSKCTGDLLAGLYADAHGLAIVRARPFNHAGPRQLPIFIVSSLARQAAEARRAGAGELRIVTGNPQARRDFTDVRDVARAYRLLADAAEPGIYNISSAHSISAAEQIELLRRLLAPLPIEHQIDPARVRAHEVMDLRGSHDRITAATGWEPQIAFEQTMRDTIDWWEHELSRRRHTPVPR